MTRFSLALSLILAGIALFTSQSFAQQSYPNVNGTNATRIIVTASDGSGAKSFKRRMDARGWVGPEGSQLGIVSATKELLTLSFGNQGYLKFNFATNVVIAQANNGSYQIIGNITSLSNHLDAQAQSFQPPAHAPAGNVNGQNVVLLKVQTKQGKTVTLQRRRNSLSWMVTNHPYVTEMAEKQRSQNSITLGYPQEDITFNLANRTVSKSGQDDVARLGGAQIIDSKSERVHLAPARINPWNIAGIQYNDNAGNARWVRLQPNGTWKTESGKTLYYLRNNYSTNRLFLAKGPNDDGRAPHFLHFHLDSREGLVVLGPWASIEPHGKAVNYQFRSAPY